MKINLLSVGTRMPSWVEQGTQEYARRLPADFNLQFTEVPLGRRSRNGDVTQAMKQEAEALLARVTPRDHVVALDVRGKVLDTEQMAARVARVREDGKSLCLLVGGPDGLAPACLERADERWSLSALTLPHPLVRIVVAEQVYRIWSLLVGHPYHRA